MGDNDQATSNFRLISLTGGPQCTTWSHKSRVPSLRRGGQRCVHLPVVRHHFFKTFCRSLWLRSTGQTLMKAAFQRKGNEI